MANVSQGTIINGCVPAVLAMLHNFFYSTNFTVEDMIKCVFDGNEGLNNLNSIIDFIGENSFDNRTQDIRIAMKYISNEIPMQMIYELNNSGFFHTSVVTGVD